jgi:hypothetical protein
MRPSLISRFTLPFAVFVFIFFLLSMVQLKVKIPMMILERFIAGIGWIEIGFVSLHAVFLATARI